MLNIITLRSVKCVLVGDGDACKTQLLHTFVTNEFSEYQPTFFDNHGLNIMVDGKPIKLGLWDICPNKDWGKLRQCAYIQTDVFLICYSIVSPNVYNSVKIWYDEINKYQPNVPIILVGTKCDLRELSYDILKEKGLTVIDYEKGTQIAKEINAIKYLECSAKSRSGLKILFDEAIRTAINPLQNQKKKSCCCIIS